MNQQNITKSKSNIINHSNLKIQNILLVEPKSPDFNIYSLFKMPRLGLAILGTLARDAGYNVKIIYQEVTPLTYKHILWADIIGFSIITSTAPEGYRLARMAKALCRQKNKDTPIIFGGVHATFVPEEALKYGDYVFRGEADNSFIPFLKKLQQKNNLTEIPGLSWKQQETIIHNPLNKEKVDLNTIPIPDWSLFTDYKPGVGIVMTSRGCPYNCNFCSVTPMLGHKYRMRSESLIMKDLAAIENKYVFFYDDNFAANRERTKKLLKRIIAERGTTHHVQQFSAQVRVDIARDPELLDLMKQAGFRTFYIGFESINPQTLELYNKSQTIDDIKEGITEIHKRGISIHGMFVFGSDADGKATFKETNKFVKQNKIETVQYLILTPLPGTEHFNKLKTEGRILCNEWERYDAFNAVFLPKKMSPYHLQIWTIKAMRRFYTLTRILKNLIKGKLWFAGIYAYGWINLLKWTLNNRKTIKKLKEDSHKVFIPEFLKTYCPVLHL
ncbi:MAG: B12-binding domain-containing radical SAM protein [Spirochaetales bacterium]|nr:B12-binding domain-containing radical SAM protein [Spirochaetales bacterium]